MVPLSQPLLSRRLLSSLFTSPVVLGMRFFWAQDIWFRCLCQHCRVRRQDSALSHGHVLGSFPPWFVSSCSSLGVL